MKHILGWILGFPICLLDIIVQEITFALWCKALEQEKYEEWQFFLYVHDIFRSIQYHLDYLAYDMVLPKVDVRRILP